MRRTRGEANAVINVYLRVVIHGNMSQRLTGCERTHTHSEHNLVGVQGILGHAVIK